MRFDQKHEIKVKWHKPVELQCVKDGYEKRQKKYDNKRIVYTCKPEEFDRIPDKPGIYCFARVNGESISPIYIGKADNLRKRTDQHLRDMNFMFDIKDAKKGKRIILFGELILQPRQRAATILPILERSYIDHALSNGCTLVNSKCTKAIPLYRITSSGHRRTYYRPFPDQVQVASKNGVIFALPTQQEPKITLMSEE